MNKKKTWGTNLLAIIVTISIVFSIGGNVWADPVEPGNQEPAASSEQEEPEEPSDPAYSGDPTDPADSGDPTEPAEPGEPTDPAEPPEAPPSNRKGGADQAAPQSNEPQETYNISGLPDAAFKLVPGSVEIGHSGYTDIKCKFDPLTFGKLYVNGETLVAADLKLTFSKTGTITDRLGHSIPFTVTNGTHDLPSTHTLEFKYSWNENDVYEPFSISVYIDLDDYKTLSNGNCTGKIDYTSTWVNAFNPNASYNNYPNISGPSGSINFNMRFYGPEYESGTFESGTQWEFNNGNLHIGGTGSMPDFTSTGYFQAPWIERKNEITSVTIDDDVTNIGDYAFSGCQNLTQVNIGRRSKLTYIGERAFQSCGFSSITLPDDLPLTTIREAAFFNCQKLEKIDLTGCYRLTTISKWAFGYCMKMGTVELPYNLTDIGEAAFEFCYDLATIRIPSGVTRIEKNTFYYCTDLTSVSTTNNITSIGVGAFEGCRNLKNFVFPTQITEISDSTFLGCSELTSITIPSKVKSIGQDAFHGCSKLEQITIPKSVNYISAQAFYGCRSLTAVYCSADPDKLVWGESSNDFIENMGTTCYVASRFLDKYKSKFSGINVNFEAYIIDSGSCGDGVTYQIDGDGAMVISKTGAGTGAMTDYTNYSSNSVPWLSHREDITSLTINDGVTSIGDWAFYYCKSLEDVSLADSIASIGVRAFGETASLNFIKLPANLKTIGDYAFCVSMIKSVTIPDSVTTIGNGAFLSAYEMTSITIGDHVQTIGEEAFSSTKLVSVTLPASVTQIGDSAFRDCGHLKTVTLSQGITSIGEEAFLYCTSLQSINIPEGVTTIKKDAFYGCYDLKSITIPGSVQEMGTGVFRDCKSLASATISDGVTSISNGTFYNCGKLKDVTIPDTVTSIGIDAFHVESYIGTGSIESIVIPTSVTSIDSGAFYGQGLRSITIPGSVSVIKEDAFRDCDNLETVIILDGVTEIEGYAFAYSDNIKTVSIPGSVTSIGASQVFGPGANLTDIYSYSEATPWISFSYGVGYNTDTKLHVPADKVESYRQLLNPDSALISGTNLVGDAEGSGQINTGAGVHLYGYNLSLAGDIGVNFWMKLDAECAADYNYMLFTVNGETQKVKVSEATAASNSEYLVFTCGVTAKEMTDTITAQFYLADGTAVGSTYSYTVREYANYILTHDSYAQKAKDVAKAMLNYGACSQKYFNYHTDSLANSVLPENERFNQISSPDEIGIKTPGEGCLTPVKVSLSLKSTVTLKLYFNSEDAEGKIFKSNGKTLETVKSGGYTVVIIDNISASHIHSGVGFDVYENDAKIGNVVYSPAKYIKIVLSMPTDNVITDDLKLAVSSLYNFNQALQIYIQSRVY